MLLEDHAWTKNTGEPDDAKVSRPVRREAGGKGSSRYLAISLPYQLSLAIDLEKDFVSVPFVAWPRPSAAELIGVRLAELPSPLTDCFVGDDDAALSE